MRGWSASGLQSPFKVNHRLPWFTLEYEAALLSHSRVTSPQLLFIEDDEHVEEDQEDRGGGGVRGVRRRLLLLLLPPCR